MFNVIWLTWWLVGVGIRVVAVDANAPQKIVVSVAPNTTTTLRFTQPIDPHSLVVGDPDRFEWESTSPQQVNVKALSRKYGYSTNMNLLAVGGEALVFELRTATADQADNVVTIELPGHSLSCAEQKAAIVQGDEQQLLRELAENVRFTHLDARTVQAGVILQILDTVRTGARAWLRFAVQNRTRSRWQAGEVRLELLQDGHATALPARVFMPQNPIDSDDTIFGALAIPLAGGSKTTVRLKVEEKNGGRGVSSADFTL